jgi:ABC-type transport system involved in multi-copper enzyme maturation permease subunit
VLPIVQRELQTAARNPRLYRWRTLSGLAVLVIVPMIVVNAPVARRWTGAFTILGNLALFLCLLEGIRKTSDAISTERREGTLGLLFLSTLTGGDIIFGKLTAATIRSLSTLLVFIPLLSITLLVGGTTGGEFWRGIFVLILALVMSLSVCLCFSTITREGALTASITFVLLLCILPNIIGIYRPLAPWIQPMNPFWIMRNASDSSFSLDPWPFWSGVVYLIALTLFSLGIASLVLPRAWQDRPFKTRATARFSSLPPKLVRRRRAMLDRNPAMWLMFDPRAHRHLRFAVEVVLVLVVVVLGMSLFVDIELAFPVVAVALAAVVLASSVHVARLTTRNFFEARHNGALELILSTPLKVKDILNGQWLAIRADLFPAMIVFSILSAIVFTFVLVSGQPAFAIFVGKALVEAVLGIATLAALGIWMGLKAKSPGRAFIATFVVGFIAPHLFFCIPAFVIQGVILLIALDKVQVQFRRFVAEQYLATPTLASIAPAPPNTPPVIR